MFESTNTSHTSDNSSTFLNFPFHYQLLQHFPIQEQRPIRMRLMLIQYS